MDILFGRNQLPVVISFFVCGIVSGIVFDLFKVKRIIFGEHKAIVIMDDFIFMLINSVIIIFNAYAFNDGNLKWYEIPLVCCGFYTYNKLFSDLFMKTSSYIIMLIKKLINATLAPGKQIVKALSDYFRRIMLWIAYLNAKKRILSARL